ncbi:hypothetical protein AbraIFM66950_010683, partial [Aspergillus brasiliensis]
IHCLDWLRREAYFDHYYGKKWPPGTPAAESNPRAGEIVCVLDAFDECEPSGRVQLAQALCKLYNAPKNINLKFLITSRPYGEILRGFQPLECPGLPVIHLSGENDVESRQIATEIGLYVRARVKRMREKLKLSIPEERLLLKELLKVPNRTYLWVRLTIDVIERDIDIDKTGIKAAISCLPETVDEAYEKILCRCRDPRKAKRIFHIMVATTRPLTVREMDVALAVTASHKKHGDLELKQEDRLHAIIREMCGLFVTVIDGHFYFLHETSRTFLVKPKGTKNNGRACENISWKHSIILHDAHYFVAQICSTYLLLEEFGKSNALRHISAERYAFLDYAATFWTLHARQALTVDSSLLLSMLQLIDVQSQCFKTWTRIYFSRGDDRCLLKVDSLIIAAYFGLCPLVSSLLSRGDTDIERVDLCYGRSALHWAAVNGHIEVTKHLVLRPRYKFMERLRIGRLMHLRDAQGRTPLMNAVVNGHVEIAKILLRLGSENDIRDALGRTSAEYAVLNKNKQMISMLKEHGLKINTTEEVLTFTDVDRHELLRMAARYGHTEVVIALLRNTPDSQIETWLKELLWIATQRDHEDVMKALLERIPENTQMSTRRYRLIKSSDRCLNQVIMMLLKDGLDNMIPLDENQNPLMTTAAGRGYDNVVMSLISKSKQHEVTDALPLCLAAMCGQIKTVELLLKHVHPSNIAEFAGRALRTTSAASQESQIAIAKILIRGGADINHIRPSSYFEPWKFHGRTPLTAAVREKQRDLVELLLDSGANINAEGSLDTPLNIAIKLEAIEIALLLIERGADISRRSHTGRTPLMLAAGRGSLDLVMAILLKKADPGAKDIYGRTALYYATKGGHAKIASTLEPLLNGRLTFLEKYDIIIWLWILSLSSCDFEALDSPAMQITALSQAVSEGADLLPWADMVNTFGILESLHTRTSNRYAKSRVRVEFSAAAILRQEHLGKTIEYLQNCVNVASEETPKTAALSNTMTSGTPGPNHEAAVEMLKESLSLDAKCNDVQRQLKKLEAIVRIEGWLAGSDQGDRHKELQDNWMGEWERIGEVSQSGTLVQAQLFMAWGEFEKAEELLRLCLVKSLDKKDLRRISKCQHLIFSCLFGSFGSSLHQDKQQPQVGAIVDQATAALAAYQELGPYSVPLEFFLQVSHAFESLGQSHNGQERARLYSEALQYLEIGESISERLRQDLSSSSGLDSLHQKQMLVASSPHSGMFHRALALTLALSDAEKMWRWTQKAKARALSDMVGSQLDSYPRHCPPGMAADDQIVSLLEEEARLVRKLKSAVSLEKISPSMELERVRSTMEEHPVLGRLLASRAGKIDLQDLQWLFGNGKGRGLPADSKVVLVDWVVIGDTIVMLTLDAKLEPQMSVLDVRLTHVRVWKQRYLSSHTSLVSAGRPLVETTLDQLNDLVSGLSQFTHEGDLLVFCPTKTLHAIPLHALKIKGVPVILRNPVAYTASVSLLRQCCEKADSKLRERAGRLRTAFFSTYEDHTTDEKNNETPGGVRVHYKASVRLRFGALATHPNILYQCLVLSDGKTPTTSSHEQDSHRAHSSTYPYRSTLGPQKDAFTVRDAFSFHLNLSIASIIACSSGVQDLGAGDEPQGLLSALQYAGCATAIGTLWPVRSDDGRDSARYFFQSVWCQGDTTTSPWNLALSFQKAVKRLQRRKDLLLHPPYYWAAFVVHGAWYL